MIDDVRGVAGVEGIAGVEAPGHGGDGDAGFLRGLYVADFIAHVEHFTGMQREGFADRLEVLGLAGELGGGGDESEMIAQAVGVEEEIDVLGGILGEDAEGFAATA